MNFRERFIVGYRIFGLIVVLLMIVLGLFLLLSDYFNYLPWNTRIAFALFMLSMGAFRIVNMAVKYKRQKDEEKND